MKFSKVSLHTFGYVLPPLVLTSADIEARLAPVYERLRLPPGRLELMSGIRERRLWEPGTRPSEAAAKAGQDVLERGCIDPQEVECLIFTSVSRDMMEPATASFVHDRLGLSPNCLIFDLSNACLGFLDGMVLLASLIEQGQVNNGLLVAGETAEELVESTIMELLNDQSLSRKTIKPAFASLTIGSGSVGLFLCSSQENDGRPRLVQRAWQANTRYSRLCQGAQQGQSTTLMNTDSEELLLRGVETAQATWQQFSSAHGWSGDDIDCFCCHQVGTAHARLLFSTLRLNSAMNFETLEFLGNVGSVSAPITLAMAMEQQRFIAGQKAALLGIGSGINSLMLGIEW
ncbi:MAG: 3-oxoacyl-ACP synthase III [Desulfobulbaceae bacterium]|uniref:3-oxoacyl-ACP synthase III n=1 Tax=Candidatus Desulfatifera sulfidica TaxID=2841691 RepID=A0A8J6TCX2_9BACT|nr:3-oxoacyl-ACP synthase III [Candidatus Desulfatifera sulfidica]